MYSTGIENSNGARCKWRGSITRVLAGIVAGGGVLIYSLSISSAAAVPARGAESSQPSASIVSLDGPWLLATDPRNVGRTEQWWRKPVPEAKPTRVPWIIQEAFPGYHGVAWYWRDFVAPAQPRPAGRYLLRFWAVDYMGEVWLNGTSFGKHESGETPFVIDVTDTIKAGATNHLCVRVLNPSLEPIDGMTMGQTPHQARVIPYSAGAAYNCGGIMDSVELMLVPAVRVEDLYASPDPKTGIIRIEANLRNAGPRVLHQRLALTVAPAASGEMLNTVILDRDLPPGDTLIKAELKIDQPHLWDVNDPYLYRVTLRTDNESAGSLDERSVRCGFRDFRFENGSFRLNGRGYSFAPAIPATISLWGNGCRQTPTRRGVTCWMSRLWGSTRSALFGAARCATNWTCAMKLA